MTEGPSSRTDIVLNLRIWKHLPLKPQRCCLNKMGPGESNLMATATIASGGSRAVKVIPANRTSMHRFTACSNEVSGPRCNSTQMALPSSREGCLNISETVPSGMKLTGNGRTLNSATRERTSDQRFASAPTTTSSTSEPRMYSITLATTLSRCDDSTLGGGIKKFLFTQKPRPVRV